jgi:hypothetical protein
LKLGIGSNIRVKRVCQPEICKTHYPGNRWNSHLHVFSHLLLECCCLIGERF